MKELEELVALFETMTATAASKTQEAVFQWCLDATREKMAEITRTEALEFERTGRYRENGS